MNLKDYSDRIINTTEDDWTIITCWGFGTGPSYLERSAVWATGEGKCSNIEIESHGMVASLKPDLSISIAWGLQANPDFKEEWANKFPDPHASSGFVDFFYNGILVYRDIYVSVDGGRCRLPLPDREFDEKTHKVIRLTVPRKRGEFFRMLEGFESLVDFDGYLRRVGFVIVDSPWMV